MELPVFYTVWEILWAIVFQNKFYVEEVFCKGS